MCERQATGEKEEDRMLRRGVLGHVLVCVGVAVLGACVSQSGRQSSARMPAPVLRVAVPVNAPPYAFRRGDAVTGMEVDFASELAAAIDRRLQLIEIPFAELLPALRAGRADMVMAGMTITPARAVTVAFSDPYLRSGLLTVMRREDMTRFKNARSVLQTTDPIGVVEGTTAERFVRDRAPTASILVYPTASAAIDELRQRRVRVVVHDAPVAIWFAGTDEANLGVLLELLNQEQLGWAIRPDDEALRAAVNGTLARWRTDGTLASLLGRWVPYWQRLESEAPAR
jgi:ABC-type amino acid transport substrate-binding protein